MLPPCFNSIITISFTTRLQPATLTTNDEMTCCLIVNTCEYCSNESMKIQKKFHEEINEKFKDKLDLQHLVDKCQVYISTNGYMNFEYLV